MSDNKSVMDTRPKIDKWRNTTGVSISVKILAVTLGMTVVVLLVSGIVSFVMSRDAMEEKIHDQLTSVREIKGQQIEDYINTIELQTITFSENPAIVKAMSHFRNAFKNMPEQAEALAPNDDESSALLTYYREEYFARLRPNTEDKLSGVSPSDYLPKNPASVRLQEMYITDNHHPTGAKDKLNYADKSTYGKLHETFHPVIRSYLEKFGYYDIFLVDHETGHIVYSVFKEVDYATSLLTGPYKDTNFAQAFKAASESDDKNFTRLVDFSPYYPSYNAPASFIASPIFDGEKKIGILVFQMPIDRINDIMTSNQNWKNIGLGETGETYIVGSDFTMRNQSRFLIEDISDFITSIRSSGLAVQTANLIEGFGTTIGLLPVETEGTKAALAGETGTALFKDYRGVKVFSSYRPLQLNDVDWAIMSEIDQSEAFAPIEKLKDRIILGASVLIAIAIYLAFFFSRSMTVNIKELTKRAEALSHGKLDNPVDINSSDEIGQLARNFEQMRLSIQKLVNDLESEKNELENRVSERTDELDSALHSQQEQTEALEQKNADMLKIQEELKTAEEDQKANKERIDSILQASPDGISAIDTKGIIQIANQSLLKIFGYTAEEVMGQKINMMMPDAISHEHDHYLDRIVWGREPKLIGKGPRVVEGRRKDGSFFPMELSVSQVGEGDDALFVGIVRDITERNKMEASIREQSAFQAALLDAIPIPIFVKDMDLKFTAFNLAYEEAFSMRREEYIGKTVLDVNYMPEDARKGYQESDKQLIEKGGFTREEVIMKYADGVDHDCMYWRRTFDLGDGIPGGMLGQLIDITERKDMEREMEESKKLAESANETKSAFLANMSHELRTPMNAIIGYAEILKEDAEDEDNEEIVPDLDKIISAGRHLLQLINDVLDISKIEAGRMEMYLEDFELSTMIDDVSSTTLALVQKNNNVLDTKIEKNIGSMRADMTKVRQMLFNLVSNAAKFTSDGKIGIEVSSFVRDEVSFFRLAVTDTGIGIPEDKIDHIFEEFTQADVSTTRNYGGTGLGLSLTKRFAQMMGGAILIESVEGEGSTFILEIPSIVIDEDKSTNELSTKVKKAVKPSGSRSGKILVIDDDLTARQVLKRHLEWQGYNVILAEDGEQGVALAKAEKPDAITCDIMMPNLDGWGVLEQLQSDSSTESIPVIMVSMIDDGKKGVSLGAVEHLRKPVNKEQLLHVVARHVKHPAMILIVEDDEAVQEVMKKAIESAGIEVLVAENGQVALELLKDNWPDMILLDLMMPVMDGFEFISHFRELEGAKDVPVIVVTAKDLDAQERDQLKQNVECVIGKQERYIEDVVNNVGRLIDDNVVVVNKNDEV